MNWLFSKRITTPSTRKPSTSLKASMQEKLAGYTPSAERASFEGPARSNPDEWFEFEKVKIDPDSSGFHIIPFSC